MVWLRCSALGEASQKYAHILQKVRNHVLAHGGMDFLDISLISQRFCYIYFQEKTLKAHVLHNCCAKTSLHVCKLDLVMSWSITCIN